MSEYAAIKRQQDRRREEETMTPYRDSDLEKGWEFKIMRSVTGAFKNTVVLQTTVQRESIGGWELLEKFDDERLRFRRLMTARNNDANLPQGYDPYRTQVGISEGALVIYILVGLAVIIGGIMGTLALLGVL